MNKRQSYREYATQAFRFLAREGNADKYISKLVEDYKKQAKSAGINCPTEAALMHKEKLLKEHAAEIADLDAAEKALIICGRDPRKAVELVYQWNCWDDLEWGDVSTRVDYANINIPADRSQIYRWLAQACKEFAKERGLRT